MVLFRAVRVWFFFVEPTGHRPETQSNALHGRNGTSQTNRTVRTFQGANKDNNHRFCQAKMFGALKNLVMCDRSDSVRLWKQIYYPIAVTKFPPTSVVIESHSRSRVSFPPSKGHRSASACLHSKTISPIRILHRSSALLVVLSRPILNRSMITRRVGGWGNAADGNLNENSGTVDGHELLETIDALPDLTQSTGLPASSEKCLFQRQRRVLDRFKPSGIYGVKRICGTADIQLSGDGLQFSMLAANHVPKKGTCREREEHY
jgi:hypothetical protein